MGSTHDRQHQSLRPRSPGDSPSSSSAPAQGAAQDAGRDRVADRPHRHPLRVGTHRVDDGAANRKSPLCVWSAGSVLKAGVRGAAEPAVWTTAFGIAWFGGIALTVATLATEPVKVSV